MNEYMKIAKELANDNLTTNAGGPFGACVVKNGKIIGKGSNHVLANNDPTAHAEIIAIRNACKKLGTHDLTGCEIYTSCYPCPMCFCAILWANVNKVYYGCNTTDTEIIGFRDKAFEEGIPQKKMEICEEVDRKECLTLYEDYKKIQDKTMY